LNIYNAYQIGYKTTAVATAMKTRTTRKSGWISWKPKHNWRIMGLDT